MSLPPRRLQLGLAGPLVPGWRLTLLALTAVLLAGCATTECPRPAGTLAATPQEAADGRLAEGALVRWGGVVSATRNLRDHTEIEVIGYPLTSCGRPRTGNRPVGRFILLHPGYLETAQFQPGQVLSATGRFVGLRAGPMGTATYRYPLLESTHPQRWGEPAPTYDSYWRPRFNIGISGGSGGRIGGGVGVIF